MSRDRIGQNPPSRGASQGFLGVEESNYARLVSPVVAFKGRMSLIGNVNNAQTLLRGTPDDVYKQARAAIEAGIDIVAPECAVPLRTPIANLKAIVAAAEEGY